MPLRAPNRLLHRHLAQWKPKSPAGLEEEELSPAPSEEPQDPGWPKCTTNSFSHPALLSP